MKNMRFFGSVVLVIAIAVVCFFFLSSGNNARVVEPAFVMKEGTVLYSLSARMQQNRQFDVKYQYGKGLLNKLGGKLLNSMKTRKQTAVSLELV
ncbi:hypothetical protein L085_07505 [Serratia sp. FS14]|uniref:hypothetical protein n=1 Tax=Serratia sp. (strain FS14) TaxID=1327989 RepID=UPI0004995471|nr:hypothetical protein [Serratia sp. FS14]AIA46952.1 hypothetical protein L085_07505 [Serratia sp. FS14]